VIGKKFIELRKQLKLSQKAMSKELSVSQSAISQIEKGKTSPASELLQNISKAYNININWLLTGIGSMYITPIYESVELSGYKPSIIMPISGEISAGHPIENSSEQIGKIALAAEQLPGNPEEYIVLRVNGCSMEPNIMHSDYVIIKREHDWETNKNKICAVRINGEITLKHLAMINKTYVLFPYNHHFEPIILDQEEDVLLIGSMYLLIRKY
jgi:SOS-response transcriptional repressor LexA